MMISLFARLRTGLRLAVLCACATVLAACATPVDQEQRAKTYAADKATATGPAASRRGATHYVEFRARFALSYGHTFLVHGRLGPGNRLATKAVAGLHPAGDDPSNWVLGHFVPVKSETGASDGDTEDEYVSARYRVYLTSEQYAKVSAYIRNLQASSPTWHAVWYNCNAFVGDVAGFMGLSAPSSLDLPVDYINGLRRLNGGRSRVDLPGG